MVLRPTYETRGSQTPKIEIEKLAAPQRYFDYNDTKQKCCSLAALILLYYYADIRNDRLTNYFFDGNPRSLFTALLSYIQLNGENCPLGQSSNPYATPNSLKLGLNAFLDTQNEGNLRLTDGTGLPPKGLARMVIGSARVPAIVCYKQNPSSNIGHAVFCYGYRYITLNGQEIQNDMIVNDGWGNNDVYTSIDYAYSFQYLINQG